MTDKANTPATEALRLAATLEGDYCPDWLYEQGVDEIAAELRRQHDRIAELEAQIEAVGAGGVQPLLSTPKATATPKAALGATPGAVVYAELEQLKGRISRIGLDIDSALRGKVNEQSPLGAARLQAIAALAVAPKAAPTRYVPQKDADAEHGKQLSVYGVAPQAAPSVDEREAFEEFLKAKPEVRHWNTTDAMLCAFNAGRRALLTQEQKSALRLAAQKGTP